MSITSPSAGGSTDVWHAGRRLGHVAELDGLRGIAIGLVIAVHSYSPLFPGGGSGVDLFFILSGFLITKLLFEERDKYGDVSLRDFYMRRAFRLLPALSALLLFLLVASFTFLDDVGSTTRVEIIMTALFVSNLFPLFYGFDPRFALGHTWSLGIEEQYYWIWPLLVVGVKSAFRAPVRFAVTVVAVTMALALGGRIVVGWLLDYPHWGAIPMFTMEGLALGSALAIFLHVGRLAAVKVPNWLFAGCTVLVTLDLFLADHYETVGLNLRSTVMRVLYLVIVAAVLLNRPEPLGALLRFEPLRFAGRISYSWYLWHIPVFYIFEEERHPGTSGVVLFVVKQALALGAATASYYAMEQPALRARHRLLAKRAPRPTAVTTF